MKKTENILGILIMISMLGTLFLIPGATLVLMMCLTVLSTIYLYFSFALFNKIRLRNILKQESYNHTSRSRVIGAIGVGLSLSCGLLGILFKFQSWPGAYVNLYTGLVSISIVAAVVVIKMLNKKEQYYISIFKRLLIVGIPVLVLILLPRTALIDFKYRNYPAYLNALKNSEADPDNQHLQDILTEQQQKMYEEQVK